jgi:hypothetical protein
MYEDRSDSIGVGDMVRYTIVFLNTEISHLNLLVRSAEKNTKIENQ